MEQSSNQTRRLLLLLLLLLSNYLYILVFLLCITSTYASTNDSDLSALLDFKNKIIQDPLRIMTTWNQSIHFCEWVGVTCDTSSLRVTILNLDSLKLAGTIPPSFGNLTFLTGLNLRNNTFSGQLPQELGRLARLQHLNLTWNSFAGKIPTNLSHCTELKVLDVNYNRLVGNISDELSSLSKLVLFGLGSNNLTGVIPRWIGNFSSLYGISFLLNNFHGTIPDEIGKLSKLGKFQIYGNYISGMIPSSIYNISSIYYFSVTQNRLHGTLPADVGLTLPNLEIFARGVNNFTGPIPLSLSNTSGLQVLDFAENSLTGTIPRNPGNLQALYRINFDQNRLGNGVTDDLSFFYSLANCTSLEVLGLAQNRFVGELPRSISNLSGNLQILTLGSNFLHGKIPTEIENLVNLSLLGLEDNRLSGSVPGVVGKLKSLQGLYLNLNKFSGKVPSTLGNLTSLTRLFMEGNSFEGRIPPSLGDCQNLQELNMSSNNLSGSIPKVIMSLPSLSISLTLSNNSLTGPIPDEIGNLNNLVELDLSGNKISGKIPSTIGKCISFERLRLQGNFLEGTIPGSLEALRGIEEIDLSRNNLSGKIPDFLDNILTLRYLNLSYNNFEGNLSTQGVFSNASAVSVYGNENLCGGISELKLPPCSRKRSRNGIVVIAAIASAVFIAILITSCCIVKTLKRRIGHPTVESQGYLPYSEILKATKNFSAENVIGSGSFGTVYKGILSGEEKIVAVKVLNLQQQGALKSFTTECDTLKSVKHRNLLKIINACSSLDHRGNEFKALVFEFMSNGNLDQWLHQDDDRRYRLSFIQRLNITIDVASALDYLHNYCEIPIVHCDLKPSNVLLDEDLVAHVGDFGLATFLLESSLDDSSAGQGMTTGLKGSIGYIPPEYGTAGQVSVRGDIYSFGMLLLEIFTGKRPTDEMFKDGLSIHNFTSMALPGRVHQIVDPSMSFIENENDENYKQLNMDNEIEMETINNTEECLVSLLRIGLSCSDTEPSMRMPVSAVVNTLQAIRDHFLKFKNSKSKKRLV